MALGKLPCALGWVPQIPVRLNGPCTARYALISVAKRCGSTVNGNSLVTALAWQNTSRGLIQRMCERRAEETPHYVETRFVPHSKSLPTSAAAPGALARAELGRVASTHSVQSDGGNPCGLASLPPS